MNTKLIIASLIIGSSSIVMADPGVVFSASAQDAYGSAENAYGGAGGDCDHQVYDHRFGDGSFDAAHVDDRFDTSDVPAPAIQTTYRREGWHGDGWDGEGMLPPLYRPVMLANGASFANQGRKFITVGRQAGRFDTLQISAAGGRTFIQQVYVQFDDGQEQVVRDLDRTLVGNQTITFNLDGGRRAIRRIVVYGSDGDLGWRSHADYRSGRGADLYSEDKWRGALRRRHGGGFNVTAA